MDIEITSLLELDQFALSHSRAEGGQNAGPETWQAAQEQAAETPILDSPEKLQALRDFARSSGGWDDEEITAWSDQEINALFLQWVASDCRECPALLNIYDGDGTSRFSSADSLEEIDWEETEKQQEAGQTASNLFRAEDGSIFFYLGN